MRTNTYIQKKKELKTNKYNKIKIKYQLKGKINKLQKQYPKTPPKSTQAFLPILGGAKRSKNNLNNTFSQIL